MTPKEREQADRLLKQFADRIDPHEKLWTEFDGYREDDGASWWCVLAPGWWHPDERVTLHEGTYRELVRALKECRYEPDNGFVEAENNVNRHNRRQS